MLNNNLFFSLIISSLSTLTIYLLTNRKNITNESNYSNKELINIFLIIFTICLSVNYFKNGGFNPVNNQPVSMRSGESLLTHSSRPPF